MESELRQLEQNFLISGDAGDLKLVNQRRELLGLAPYMDAYIRQTYVRFLSALRHLLSEETHFWTSQYLQSVLDISCTAPTTTFREILLDATFVEQHWHFDFLATHINPIRLREFAKEKRYYILDFLSRPHRFRIPTITTTTVFPGFKEWEIVIGVPPWRLPSAQGSYGQTQEIVRFDFPIQLKLSTTNIDRIVRRFGDQQNFTDYD